LRVWLRLPKWSISCFPYQGIGSDLTYKYWANLIKTCQRQSLHGHVR
jgi:hypothetical protein